MRVTIDLPGVTPEFLDLAVGYYGAGSHREVVQDAVMAMVEAVKDDAIAGPDGKYLGARSEINESLCREEMLTAARKAIAGQQTEALEAEVARLQAEVARLRAELRDNDGEGWKDSGPASCEEG